MSSDIMCNIYCETKTLCFDTNISHNSKDCRSFCQLSRKVCDYIRILAIILRFLANAWIISFAKTNNSVRNQRLRKYEHLINVIEFDFNLGPPRSNNPFLSLLKI